MKMSECPPSLAAVICKTIYCIDFLFCFALLLTFPYLSDLIYSAESCSNPCPLFTSPPLGFL